MNFYYILISLFGLVCLIFLTVGTGMLSSESKKRKNYTQETTARVKELKKKQVGKPGAPGSVRYYPVFEYRANGQFVRVESKVGSDKPKYKEGDEVRIFYDPDSKKNFYIPDSKSASVIGTILTVIGIILAIAVLPIIYSLRR